MDRKLRTFDLLLASFALAGSIVSLLSADYFIVFNRVSKVVGWIKLKFSILSSLQLENHLDSLKAFWELLIPKINDWPLIYIEPSLSVIYAVFYIFLIQIIRIELKEYIIPDRYTLPGVLVGFFLSLIFNFDHWQSHAMGLLFLGGIHYAMRYMTSFFSQKEIVGGGVIKMGAMIGAFLGLENSILVLFISWTLALIYIFAFESKMKADEKRSVEFGPFLALASIICTLVPMKSIFGLMINL